MHQQQFDERLCHPAVYRLLARTGTMFDTDIPDCDPVADSESEGEVQPAHRAETLRHTAGEGRPTPHGALIIGALRSRHAWRQLNIAPRAQETLAVGTSKAR